MINCIQLIVAWCLVSQAFGGQNGTEENSLGAYSKTEKDEKSVILCKCGYSHNLVKRIIDMSLAEEIFRLEAYASLNRTITPRYTDDILHMLKKCSSCKISYTRCFGDPNDFDDYFCHKNSAYIGGSRRVLAVSFNGTNFSETIQLTNKSLTTYPKEVYIPITDAGSVSSHHHHHHHRRTRREDKPCAYPTSMQTSGLKCMIFPNSVKCTQICAMGFTLKDGTQVTRFCNQTENVWRPGNFEECMPYVDCTLTMVSGGSKNCSTPTTEENARCVVKCEDYEDKKATFRQKYTCGVSGNWWPPLPFCVQAGSGLELAPKPLKKQNYESDNYLYADEF